MATKISDLSALAGSAVQQTSDVLPIVDTSVTTTKKILVSDLSLAMNVNGTEQATTSGTAVSFSIPAWASKIVMMLKGVSIGGVGYMYVRATGVTAACYGAVRNAAGTVTAIRADGLDITPNAQQTAAMIVEGFVELTIQDRSNNVWIGAWRCSTSNAATDVYTGAGRIEFSGILATLSLVANGSSFDAGAVNVLCS